MKLLAHLLAADLRRFRVAIPVWIAVVAAGAIVTLMWPAVPERPGVARALILIAFLLGLAHLLLSVVLVPLVVQTHPGVGSDAFWMTRPIPPRTLIASKLVLLSLVLLVVPLVSDLALMVIYQVPPVDMARAAGQNMLFRMLFLTALMSAAAITPNLARHAVLCGAALLLLATAIAIGVALAMSRMDEPGFVAVSVGLTPVTGGPDGTSTLLEILAFILAACALVWVQYHGRSVRRSVSIGVGLTIAGMYLASLWPWPVFYERLQIPAWTESPAALTLTADPRSVGVVGAALASSEDASRWRDARATVWLDGVAPGWAATARLAGATLGFPDGTQLVSRESFHPSALPTRDENIPPMRRTVRNALAVRRLLEGGPPRGENAVVFRMRAGEFERVKSQTAWYRGQFLVDLQSVEIAAILPVERDATYQDGSYRFQIHGVQRAAPGVAIRARVSNVNGTIFDTRPRPSYSFYLRNRQVSEAAAGYLSEDETFLQLMLLGFGRLGVSATWSGFGVGTYLLRFSDTQGYPSEAVRIDDGWFADAELVIVRTRREGSVPRRLEFDGFQLSERTPSRDLQSGGVTPSR
jgi:hypothetical protein